MKTINLNKVRPYSVAELKTDIPSTLGIQMINEDTTVTLNGNIVAVYEKAKFNVETIRSVSLGIEYSSYVRTSGLVTQTEGINATPRNPRRTNKCSRTKLSVTQPEAHQLYIEFAKELAKAYQKYFPLAYAQQVKQTYVGQKRVEKEYIIPRTPFTGAVVNMDSQLGFHRDSANTSNGISCMQIFKKGMAGGELILPELGIGFECQDGYLLLFDGQKYVHGVTPFKALRGRKAYRITIVYYNSKGMELCLPFEEEELFYREYLESRSR